MPSTSSRLLSLLSLLGARPGWSAQDLAGRLDVSTRTLRRDLESLRELGYPVTAIKGPGGGYTLGTGSKLPPLLLDDEQAIAVAVALQTAPRSVTGIDDSVARALSSIKQIMPAQLGAEADAMHLTYIRNPWEFAAPPIASRTLRAVGYAIRKQHLLRFDLLNDAGQRPGPTDPGYRGPTRVEPHHLVVWAGRWYLVAHGVESDRWCVLRVERMHCLDPSGVHFERRELPANSVAEYVMTSPDRGDTPASWQCLGSVVMALPAGVVSRWAPGGSVVEHLAADECRLTLGAWSWAGVAGLLATFDAEITCVEPEELQEACGRIAERFQTIAP